MKRIGGIIILFMCIFGMVGCGSKANNVKIDYGTSSLYSEQDMEAVVVIIENKFAGWDGCELHSITYASDSECNPQNIAWLNSLEAANDAEEVFTQCIMFKSDFHSPKNGGGAWNPDTEYTNWQWWLARSDSGEWKLMSWGY